MNQDTIANAMVYLVDDDASVRKAMTRLFKSEAIQIKTFETAGEFLDHERADVPGCLILDVEMPDQTGIELQAELVAQHVDIPIVFMTGHGDIPMSVKAIKEGAVDFLPKPVEHQKLLQTVKNAIARHASERPQSSLIRDFLQRVDTLSKREREVMDLVITGMLNKQIASKLGITEYTVKVHRGRMMEKTGVESLAELVRLHERSGIAADR